MANLADRTPGSPFKIFTIRPESSAKEGSPPNSEAFLAFARAFSTNVSNGSSHDLIFKSFNVRKSYCLLKNELNSFTLPELLVAKIHFFF